MRLRETDVKEITKRNKNEREREEDDAFMKVSEETRAAIDALYHFTKHNHEKIGSAREFGSETLINKLFFFHAQHIQDSLNTSNQNKVVLFGKSGSRKTSLLNNILKSGVVFPFPSITACPEDSIPIFASQNGVQLKDQIISNDFKFMFVENYLPSLEDFFLFPEGDTIETTRVCYSVNFGPRACVSLVCDNILEIQSHLERLRCAVRLQHLQDDRELSFLNTLRGDGFESISENFPVYILVDKSTLQRPLSLLGYEKTHDVSTLGENDIKLPNGYEKYCSLSFTFAPSKSLGGSDILSDINKIKLFLSRTFSIGNPLWGMLEQVRVQLPLGFLKNVGEFVDTPGIDFLISGQCRYVFNIITQASILLFLNDGRKISNETRQLLFSTGLFDSVLTSQSPKIVLIDSNRKFSRKPQLEINITKFWCQEIAGIIHRYQRNHLSFKEIQKKLLSSVRTIQYDSSTNSSSGILEIIISELTRRRYSTYENETLQCPVLDSLFLVKNLKRTLYQKFELFQSCQNFYKCDNNENYFKFEISYLSNSHINNSANFNVRMSKIFDLMGKNILSMARFEFNKSIDIMLYSTALRFLNVEEPFKEENEDIGFCKLENNICENLFVIVQNILLTLQGRGKENCSGFFFEFLKNFKKALWLKFPGNDEIELCFRQNALLRVNLFFNSEVLNRESYFNIVYEGIREILYLNIAVLESSNFSNLSRLLHILYKAYSQGITIFLGEILRRVGKLYKDITIHMSPTQDINSIRFGSRFLYESLCAQVLEYRKVLAIEKVLLTSSVEGAQRGSFSIAQDPVLHHQSEWYNKDILQVLKILSANKTAGIKSKQSLENLESMVRKLYIFEKSDYSKAIVELKYQILTLRALFGGTASDLQSAIQLCSKYDNYMNIDEKLYYLGWSWQHMRFLFYTLHKISNRSSPRFHFLNKWELSIVLTAIEDEFTSNFDKNTSAQKFCTDSVQELMKVCIQFWGESTEGFLKAEKYYLAKNLLQLCKVDAREKILIHELEYIVTSLTSQDLFFGKWGSDVLVSLHFFAEVTNGKIRDFCTFSANRLAIKWAHHHQEIQYNISCQDTLFYNEGCFGLQYYSPPPHLIIRKKILKKLTKWNLHDFFGIDLNVKSHLACMPRYDDLNSVLVWSFFFHGNGIHLQGCSSYEIYDFSETVGRLFVENIVRDSFNFISECYFVTHKVFTRTAWCKYCLNPSEWKNEKDFLIFYIGRIIQLQDIELLGEFIQTLKCLGISEEENVLKNALQFLMSKYDRKNGGWLTNTDTFESKYHATICAVGALLQHNFKGTTSHSGFFTI